MKKILILILIIICLLAPGFCIYLQYHRATPVNKNEAGILAEATPLPDSDIEGDIQPPAVTEQNGIDTTPVTASESQTAASKDLLALYAPVFRTYRLWLEGKEAQYAGNTKRGDYYLMLGETNISFLCRYVSSLGYMLQDIDYDGIPELLIGSNDEHYETEIFDMFTLVDGTPQRVIVSSERVYYKLCADYRILHYGSGGAAYNYCSLYHYNDAEIFLDYGVVMNGENYYEIYQAHENIFIDRLPDDHPISREEYFAKLDALEAETTALDLIPLSLTL